MFNKLGSKLRSKTGPHRDKHNPYTRAGVSAFSFEDFSSPTQSDGCLQAAAGSPQLSAHQQENLDPVAHYAESLFPLDSPSIGPPSVSHKHTASVYSQSDSLAQTGEYWTSSQASSSVPEEEINIGPAVLPGYEDAEEQFLEDYEDYFEHLRLDNVRKNQYPKLDLQRIIYLDYANFALFSRFQVEEHMRVLLEEGPNLGSVSLSNATSSHFMTYVFDTQQRLLQVFNVGTSEYSVIFTTGFTAGFRLFGDIYPFHKGSLLLALVDNHDSVKHAVSSLVLHGGKCIVAPVGQPDLCISSTELRQLLKRRVGRSGLFVFPAQSCVSGVRHSLNWIPEAQQNGWQVLVDVSTYLPTGFLDLSIYHPEFVLGSLHHMLGYPSGMGFLLVRRQAFAVERDSDTLKLASVLDEGNDCHIVSEDDNINLLSFAALSFGLHHLESVGLVAIQKRVLSLATWLVQTLKSLKHKGEVKPLLEVYGPQSTKSRGSIVAFNVIDSTGTFFPANLVQKLAERNNIVIGAGHFSNQGLAYILCDSTNKTLDAAVFNGKWNFSAIRVSLGPMSTFQDVYRLAQFLSRFRDEEYVSSEAMGFIEEGQSKLS